MEVLLGKTGIKVNKNGFGALPIQRTNAEDSTNILRKAYDNGINYYDTARLYSNSEEKIGHSLYKVRSNIYIATKTMALTPAGVEEDLETSLRNLRTDYIDIYQFHNPPFCPKPGDESGIYDVLLKAKEQGKIRHIGITSHLISIATEAIESGLYETLQFPFSYLADEKDMEIVNKCKSENMGFIAMKSLAGGLITNSTAAYAFMAQYPHVLPIWGIQKEIELDAFLSYAENQPPLSDELKKTIESDKRELSGDFCRGCGYCVPSCPAKIEINNCARMSLLLRRAPVEGNLTPEVQNKMKKIEECTECGNCKSSCPYGLDTPTLLKKNLKDYNEILAGKSF